METLFLIFFWGAILITLIYLTLRRISIKKTEDFEKRDH